MPCSSVRLYSWLENACDLLLVEKNSEISDHPIMNAAWIDYYRRFPFVWTLECEDFWKRQT